MKRVCLVPLAALVFSAPAFAQSTDQPMTEKPAAMQSGGTSGQNQDGGMGATGWSGPHRGQTSPGHPDGPDPSPSSDKQPAVATGEDLNGPPKAFPSNQAPE